MTHKLDKAPAHLFHGDRPEMDQQGWGSGLGVPWGGNCFCSDLTGERGLQREGFRPGDCTLVTPALSLRAAGPL